MIDLHTHSYFSDGTFSPEELILLAKEQGLCAVA
ncbi:MAG TPA: phosphoesterase, partial [Clostridium sp.]|nr:phosphoesterase [Clostridium sp.]